MLGLLRKSTAPMAKSGGSRREAFDSDGQYDVVEDLSSWEFVNASHSEEEDLCSLEEDEDRNDVTTTGDLVSGPEFGYHPWTTPHSEDVISMQSISVSPTATLNVDVMCHHLYDDDDDDDGVEKNAYDVDRDDDDDDCDYGYGLDDELVPWKLKDRFGKQRIRKLGKRDGSKLSKSKKVPYYRNKPGCLYGKHGLGVRRFYI